MVMMADVAMTMTCTMLVVVMIMGMIMIVVIMMVVFRMFIQSLLLKKLKVSKCVSMAFD